MNLIFKVTKIPDLTLQKYCAGENNGVKGMLEKHNAFLRQWNRKGVISDVSLHLYYLYTTEKVKGDKLDIYLLVRGGKAEMQNVLKMMKATPFADDYGFSLLSDSDLGGLAEYAGCGTTVDEEAMRSILENATGFDVESVPENAHLFGVEYNTCVSLSKREIFIKPGTAVSEREESFYTLSEWETSEDARLYRMLSMMGTMEQPVMYRVDLYPVDIASSIRDVFVEPIKMIYRRQNELRNVTAYQRDLESDRVLKAYETLSETVEGSPHFITNIFAFGNTYNGSDDISVILDAAGSEALESGNYSITNFNGRFRWNSFFEKNGEEWKGNYGSEMIMRCMDKGMCICSEKARNYKMRYLSTLLCLDEVAPFFRFPALYEDEVIEKKKETAPAAVENGLFLGKDTNGYDVNFPLKLLAKHAFISGVPGSGKTNTMHHLTSTMWKKHKIPFLVLEPAKQEYRALANDEEMKELYVFSPNADMSFPLHINPFEFPKGLMVAEHIRTLVSVFEGAFPLENPMPFLLDTAIEAVYRDMGWEPDTMNTEQTKLKYPTMSMLYKKLEEELKTTKYSDEIRGNLESALKVRIGSLLRREMGDVFDVPESTVSPEKWLSIPAVIELESMGSGPANFLTLMLCALVREVLKVNPLWEKDYARHVIFIEEAHNLIGPEAEEVTGGEANAKQAATAFVVKMLAEVRALKEGIVIADQLPTVMAQEVIKNTGLKIGHRITSADDRGLLGSTMAANSLQMEEMATFGVGEALISYEGLMRPFKMRMNEWGGDIRDKKKKEAYVNSKNDIELKELMADRESYRETCMRSYLISGKKYRRELESLENNGEKCLELFRKLNANEKVIKAMEEQRIQLLISDNAEAVAEAKAITTEIHNQRAAVDELYKKSPLYQDVQEYIVDYLVIYKKINNKLSTWKKLGIEDVSAMESLKKMAQGKALELFFAAREHIKNKKTVETMQKLYEDFKKNGKEEE